MKIVLVAYFVVAVALLLATRYGSASTPSISIQKVLSEKSVAPAVSPAPLVTPLASHILPQSQFVSQSYNNCGPASLSMVMSMFGKHISQEDLRLEMRPFSNPYGGVDDKSIFASEFVMHAKKHGFEAIARPGGDVSLIKKLIANGIPVIVRTWLHPNEDIGHFRIVRGYDDANRVVIQDDSYEGPNIPFSYEEFQAMWQPFNYGYILVYPKEKEGVVAAILGENMDEKTAYAHAIAKAQDELSQNPQDMYATFNMATSYYNLGEYTKSVDTYEQVAAQLPSRMLWYQLEPIYAYAKLHNSDKVFSLTDSILNNGNLAYSELYQVRGEILREQGKKEAAKGEFEKAAYYNTTFQPAKDALAKIADQ